MRTMSRIQQVSRIFRLLFVGWFVCTPIVYAVFWLGFNHVPASFIKYDFPVPVPQTLSLPFRCAALAVSLIPISVQLAGLWSLIKLFTLYSRGSIFTSEHVKCFRRLGAILLLWTVSGIVYRTLLGLVLCLATSPGQLIVSVGLASTNLTALIVGGIVLVIAWVMDEGRKLEDEQALFI